MGRRQERGQWEGCVAEGRSKTPHVGGGGSVEADHHGPAGGKARAKCMRSTLYKARCAVRTQRVRQVCKMLSLETM